MISKDLSEAEAEDYADLIPEEDGEISIFRKHNYIIGGVLIAVIIIGVIFGFTVYG